MDRRTFLEAAGAGSLLAAGALPRGILEAVGARGLLPQERRFPLPRPATASGPEIVLTARPATVDLGPLQSGAWTVNGGFPGPTLRFRRGDRARITLRNELPEPTILHWHGLDVPEAADGHPRLAIAPGAEYRYEFTVDDRPGLYWYHPHAHERTGAQSYLGMVGLMVVEDDAEAALGLPSGEQDVPVVIQDKRLAGGRGLDYAVGMGPDAMLGFLGDTPFGNGVAHPTLEVGRGPYRLRLLNAANARIFDLGLSSGDPLTLIGTDGGLLDAPARVARVMMGTGERADVLADFSGAAVGDRIVLRSFPFQIPGMMAMGMGMGRGMGGMGGGRMGRMGSALAQGAAMDVLEFVVTDRAVAPARALPERLAEVPREVTTAATPRRTFRFDSMMMRHTINGRSFALERVDERIALGRTEVWSLVNDSSLPHPVHIHSGRFQVLGRSGGRGRLLPWEAGLKDTVLVLPGERVDVAVRFTRHPGLFLMHCHNMEHEDAGMMLNFLVEP